MMTLDYPGNRNAPPAPQPRSDDPKIHDDRTPSYFPCLDSTPGLRGGWQSTEVQFRDLTQLRLFCKKHDVPPLSIFQTAWALVLRCYVGNSKVCFICSSAEVDDKNSKSHGFDSANFNKSCKLDFAGTTTILDVLRDSCRTSGSELLSSSHGQLNSTESLPVNTSLIYQEVTHQGYSGIGRLVAQDYSSTSGHNCEVSVYVSISDDDLLLSINYLETVLSVTSAPNVGSVYEKAIIEILANPHRSADAIDLFTQRDLGHITRWNACYPCMIEECVHDLILKNAKSAPHSPAVCSWDGDFTYQQLDSISFRLARYFVSSGIKHETLVPVCFTKSIYAVVAMVAILRAGGAFIPLDPLHPQDRLKSIIEKSDAKIVVASPETVNLFCGAVDTVINLCGSLLESLDPSLEHAIPKVRTDNAAFVLFTSGSTGKPKGIVQEHASVSTSSLAHGRFLGVTSNSRVFQYAAFTFDVSMMDIFTTLIHGGCVCIPSEEDRMGSFTFAMNKMEVNWVLLTPSVASLISPDEVPMLQTLVFGGEAVKQENISQWFGKVRLFNCYGPAECGACAMSEVTHQESRPGNIGKQFGAQLCWVVDPENHNRLQPSGAVGELLVEGPTLARGYLGDIAKTQAVFIKSRNWPRGAGNGRTRRLYKTGDLIRQNSDGTFDFAGRKDLQLKVRGQRVELGEVEHHLSAFTGIRLSMATMPQSGAYARTLVAVIQLNQQTVTQARTLALDLVPNDELTKLSFDKEKLFHSLRSKLAKYMVPSHLFVVSRIPLSASGKIDRKVVEAWLVKSSRIIDPQAIGCSHKKNQLPQGNVTALEICSKILSLVSKPGSEYYDSLNGSNFGMTAVGLDSVQVISLTMFIRQRYGVKVHLDILVDPDSTVQTVAKVIEKLLVSGHESTAEHKTNIIKTFQEYRQDFLTRFSPIEMGVQNVFVTGATGFLGSRILCQLCRRNNVRKITVLVRSSNSERALQRITKIAKSSGWWTKERFEKLEIWVGDLAKPRLGLNKAQWLRLCGCGPPVDCVTTVIHSGAAVNWNAGFPSLRAINVDSTVELLKAAAQSNALLHFVFVSGGQQLNFGEDKDTDLVEEVARTNGYAQTKLLSELMVKDYAQRFAPSQQCVSIVKPSFIIGSVRDGVGISNDFIWRLIASNIDIKGYTATDADSWVFVSDVDTVAAIILDCCCSERMTAAHSKANVVKVLDGIPVSEFWDILKHDFKYVLYPLDSEMWLGRIHDAIASNGEKHPLFPLLQTVEEGRGNLGSPFDPQQKMVISGHRVKAAMKKNIEYLSTIGFLPNPAGSKAASEGR